MAEMDSPIIQWNSKDNTVVFYQRKSGRKGITQHNYKVSISLGELAEVLEVVSSDGVEESTKEISKALVKAIRPLLRLVNISVGVSVS